MNHFSSTAECTITQEHLSAYLDGALDGVTMQQVTRHLDRCEDCRHELQQWEQMQSSLAQLGTAKAPSDLALRLRVAISHERSHAERGYMSRWRDKWELFFDNSLRPFGVQMAVSASCLLVVAAFFFAGAVATPTAVEANDEPLAGFQAPRYLYAAGESQENLSSQEQPLVVEAMVDARGRIYDYSVISGPNDAHTLMELQSHMLHSVFEPAQVLGAPVRGRVVLTFSGVQVKG